MQRRRKEMGKYKDTVELRFVEGDCVDVESFTYVLLVDKKLWDDFKSGGLSFIYQIWDWDEEKLDEVSIVDNYRFFENGSLDDDEDDVYYVNYGDDCIKNLEETTIPELDATNKIIVSFTISESEDY